MKPFYKGEFCLADRLIVASDVAFDGDLSAAGSYLNFIILNK